MLATVKRDVTEEKERYGGYRSNYDTPTFDERLRSDRTMYDTYANANYSATATTVKPNSMREEQLWKKLTSNGATKTAERKNYTRERRNYDNRRSYQPKEHVGFEPQNEFKPARLYEQEEYAPPKTKRRINLHLSTQGKVILAVYLAVVLIITTLVIVNAELINKGPQAEPPATVVENVYEVNENGLSFIESPYTNKEVESNWFDKFCDKLDN